MAISTLAAYKDLVKAPFSEYVISKNSQTVVPGMLYSTWITNPSPGASPTAAEQCFSGLWGSLGQRNAGSILRLIQIAASMGEPGTLVIADRLCQMGGLSGGTTSTQSSSNSNLPTAVLPRYTDGRGVMAGLEIYNTIGTGEAEVTVIYTNQAGVANRSGKVPQLGGDGYRLPGRVIPIYLSSGDRGVRSVQTVSLNTSTGAIGNFGVTLFKPLITVGIPDPNVPHYFDCITGFDGEIPEIKTNACLWALFISSGTSSGAIQVNFKFGEE